jgi:hypothetical protein
MRLNYGTAEAVNDPDKKDKARQKTPGWSWTMIESGSK